MNGDDFYPSTMMINHEAWLARVGDFKGVREGDYLNDFVIPKMRNILQQKLNIRVQSITILEEEYEYMNITFDEARDAIETILNAWNENDPIQGIVCYTRSDAFGAMWHRTGHDVTYRYISGDRRD